MRSADLLFLPMHNLPADTRSSTVPGKTYEYLAAGRPILAAVPRGDARDILEASGSAEVCDPDDVEAMTRIITNVVASRDEGGVEWSPDPTLVGRFEYRR